VRIHHIALRTHDVPRLETFYRDVLGLAPSPRPEGSKGRSVWLAADSTLVMIEPCEPAEPKLPPGSRELVAFAISPDMRASFIETLAIRRVPIEEETSYTVYFRDPDGRRVAVSHFPELP
jgi:catechol 2,3-dioxygenase-like lactoylglutathione lyase family enzyme